MLKYFIGNLLESNEVIIAHCCNSMGVQGAGIALAIKNKYPKNYEAYRNAYELSGLKLGRNITWVDWDIDTKTENRIIVNCIGQEFYGTDRRQVNYWALATCINNTLEVARDRGYKSIGLPGNCGCALAGGSWSVLALILSDMSKLVSVDINVYCFNQEIYDECSSV